MQAGFLNEFTSAERDAIARTKRKIPIATEDKVASTNKKTGTAPNKANNTSSFKFNMPNSYNTFDNLMATESIDKVFLLDFKEVVDFYEHRGWSTVKKLSTAVAKKYNLSQNATYNWWCLYPQHNIGNDYAHVVSNSATDVNKYVTANSTQGIAPALHLKPDYTVLKVMDYKTNSTVSTNVLAKNLKIGDIVQFGTYLGEKIQWRVMNFTGEYPLLQSENILDIKVFDAKGDFSYRYSYLDSDSSFDVSTMTYTVVNTLHTNDISLPKVEVLNEEVLLERQNEKFNLNIKFTDNVGIKEITFPNGTKTSVNAPSYTTSYTFTSNAHHKFIIRDVNDNYRQYIVPVGNINLEPVVQITQSTTAWTKQNVDVKINVSNNVGWTSPGSFTQNKRDITGGSWGNYTTYAGKKIKFSGYVEYVSEQNGVDISKYSYSVAFHYKQLVKRGDEYEVSWTYPKAFTATIASLKERYLKGEGPLYIEAEYVVGNDFLSDFNSRTHINVGAEDTGNITLKWTDIKYELVDNSDFAITKIELPSGQTVNSTSYSYTISEEGEKNHKFIVHDNRGMKTERTITTRIDKSAPVVTFGTIPSNPTNKDIVVQVNVSDKTSGIQSIDGTSYVASPNGAKTYNFSYTVEFNGVYTFTVTDQAGNKITRSFNITNIDKTQPVTSISGVNSKWVSGSSTITINASDSRSSITKIEYMLEGDTVKDWTDYTAPITIVNSGETKIKARSYDAAGNISNTISSTVKIDNVEPYGVFTIAPSVSSRNITINVSGLNDIHSGLSKVRVSNSPDYSNPYEVTVVSSTNKIAFTLDKKENSVEDYSKRNIYVMLFDNAGNISSYTLTTVLTPSNDLRVTILKPFKDSLFLEDEPLTVAWDFKSSDSNFTSSNEKRAEIHITNTETNKTTVMTFQNPNKSATIRNLGVGNYTLTVHSYINDYVSVKSDSVQFRVGVFKPEGVVLTKNIQTGSPIRHVAVVLDYMVPKGTEINCYLVTTYMEDKSVKMSRQEVKLTSVADMSNLVAIPKNAIDVRLELRLIGNTNSSKILSTPILDNLVVYAR